MTGDHTSGDNGPAMSQDNVESFKRFADANNRRDVDALLAELDPDVKWQSAVLGSMGGDATLHRGHAGVRRMLRDLYEAFSEFRSRRSSGTLPSRADAARCTPCATAATTAR